MLAQLAQRIHDRVGEEDGDGEGTGPILISDDCTVRRSFPLPSYSRSIGLTEMIGHVTKFTILVFKYFLIGDTFGIGQHRMKNCKSLEGATWLT